MNLSRREKNSIGNSSNSADGTSANNQSKYFLTGLPDEQSFKITLQPSTSLSDGRFIIEELNGRGRFCDVYRAFDDQRRHAVALKVAAIRPTGDQSLKSLIHNELNLNARVTDHRHVVQIYDIHTCLHEGAVLLLLSMEHADGGSLRQWLKDHINDLELRRSLGLEFFRQLCHGVAALHEQQILDLDLKPENVLFVNGTIKIGDLGISRLLYQVSQMEQNRLGNAWPEIGTPTYMSPEQFFAHGLQDIDRRCDIYSLAVIMHEICHPDARSPFSGSYEFLRLAHLQATPPKIPGLDGTVQRVIARGLQKNPADRYETVGDLLLDLEDSLEPTTDQDIETDIQSLWNAVLEKLQTQDFNAALALNRRILELDPDHNDAAACLTELTERFNRARQFYDTIRTAMYHQSLDHLIQLLIEAVGIFPNHPDGHLVQIQLLSLTQEYREALTAVTESAAAEQWTQARAVLQQACRLNPGSSQLLRSLDMLTPQ